MHGRNASCTFRGAQFFLEETYFYRIPLVVTLMPFKAIIQTFYNVTVF